MIGLFLNLLDTQSEKDKFTALYEKYKNLLYYIAFSKVHNNEVAEECVQETFFYVAKHFDKIGKVDSSKTKGYLAAVVTGFAIDYYNKEYNGIIINTTVVPERIAEEYFQYILLI